jgi:3-hydroxyisobutyrate dehydrogenase-like beta-hydroxyacid dehydrogenase
MNIMNAIKAGILTSTTKAELVRLEAQHARLEEEIKGATAKADKVLTLLPRGREGTKVWLKAWPIWRGGT